MSRRKISKEEANLFFLTLWINYDRDMLPTSAYRIERDNYFEGLEYMDPPQNLVLNTCTEYDNIIIHKYRTWCAERRSQNAETNHA